MDPGAYKWFSDREKRSKSWGQPLEMRDFQSEDQDPIYARSCAIALEEVDVGCARLSWGGPMLHDQLTRNRLGWILWEPFQAAPSTYAKKFVNILPYLVF